MWDPLANEIELETASVYGNWQWSKWEVIGAVVNVSAIAKGGSDGANHDFTASYIQTERSVVHDITVFARVEHTSGDEQYLEIFPSYVRRQTLMGARWDFRDKHALTVEYTTSDAHADHLHRFALQWSAALR
jgi:hypothetical protein